MAERRHNTVGLVGLYEDPNDLIRAAETVRDAGCRNWDCHTPYPVHGLDRAMGLRQSPVPYVTLTAGFIGLAAAVALTGGLSVFEYPIVTSGKALFSWQAFVPIFFELFILFAAVATMLSVVAFCRLGRWHSPLHDSDVMREITCDRFAIVIDTSDEVRSGDELRKLLESTGCREIRPLVEFEDDGEEEEAAGPGMRDRVVDAVRTLITGHSEDQGADAPRSPVPRWAPLLDLAMPRWSPFMFRATLVAFVALAFIIPLGLVAVPFIEFFNGMAAQPKGKTQMTYGRVYGEKRLVERAPAVGTVPQGYQAYRFEHVPGTLEDAKRVGEVLQNPLPRSLENMRRGQELYEVFCIVCHGKGGAGDGPVTGPNRFPAPPSLHTDQARGYTDGTIFHIITKGTKKMPHYADKLEPDERWKVIYYVRALQRAMKPEPEDLKR